MAEIQYSVGERPSRPLNVTLRRPDGSPFSLLGYAQVEVVGDGLPPGITTVLDAAAGSLQHDFQQAFTTSGVFEARVKMTTAAGAVDYGQRILITVVNEAAGTPPIMSVDEVERITGTPVGVNNVAKAQSMISLAVDRDVADAQVFAGLSARDRHLVRQAVAWQAEGLRTGKANENLPAGASAVSTGDTSVSFKDGTGAHPFLAPLAMLAVRRLSWMGSRTIQLSRGTRQHFSPLVSDAHAWNSI